MKEETKRNEIVRVNYFDLQQMESLQSVCKMFANSQLVPPMYRCTTGKAEDMEKAVANCMIALDIAQRLGANPLMVMQNLVIVSNKPSWSSQFLISTINTSGKFEPLQFRFTNKGKIGKVKYVDYVWNGREKQAVTKEVDASNWQEVECVAYTCRKGSDEILESTPITIRMAIQEGWYTKAGSKWPTMTRQMLAYRAASFWCRLYAPEMSMGMQTSEELQDIRIEDAVYQEIKDDLDRQKQGADREQVKVDAPATEGDQQPTAGTAPETDGQPEGGEVQGQAQESGSAPTPDGSQGTDGAGGEDGPGF